jgi:hypothetical protein
VSWEVRAKGPYQVRPRARPANISCFDASCPPSTGSWQPILSLSNVQMLLFRFCRNGLISSVEIYIERCCHIFGNAPREEKSHIQRVAAVFGGSKNVGVLPSRLYVGPF